MAKKKTTRKKSADADKTTFEDALAELETIVHQLEDGDIGLAEAMQRYEEGVRLLKRCYSMLEKAERRIELLSGIDRDGNAVTENFDEQAEDSLNAKSARRARRRSSPATKRADDKDPCDDDSELF